MKPKRRQRASQRLQAQHDERLSALAEFIAGFEAEHGVIAPPEVEAARAAAKARAIIVNRTRSTHADL